MPLPITFGAASARGFGLFSALAAGGASWIGLFGDSGDDTGRSVALDSSGNIYFVGITNNQIQLNKYNNAGVIQWQKTLNGQSGIGTGIAIDSADNIYICGMGYGATENIQIVKYNSSGTIQWQRSLSGAGVDQAYSIAVDSSNNIYVCGNSTVSSVQGLQIVKYNSSGTIQWQRRLTATFSATGYGIIISSANDVYITGEADSDILLVKYNSSGNLQWQRVSYTSGTDAGSSVALDSLGYIYVCGYAFFFGNYVLQLLRYDTASNPVFSKNLSGSGVENNFGSSIAIDSSDNIYVCGTATNYLSTGKAALIIAKYDTSANLLWQRVFTGPASMTGSSIAVDNLNNIYICGYTPIGVLNNFFIAKLPDDGSLTGTYTVGGTSFTYAVSTFFDASYGLTNATYFWSSTTSSLTDAASSLTAANTSYTSSVTYL
jgi:uncharacterized delta-60 repeat protein